MEWAPKLLDNLDSAALALYQSWAGYYRWVFLRLAMTIVAVTAMTISPVIRLLAIAIVTTYISLEMIDRLIVRHRQPRAATARS
jgi:hypothetical protein